MVNVRYISEWLRECVARVVSSNNREIVMFFSHICRQCTETENTLAMPTQDTHRPSGLHLNRNYTVIPPMYFPMVENRLDMSISQDNKF